MFKSPERETQTLQLIKCQANSGGKPPEFFIAFRRRRQNKTALAPYIWVKENLMRRLLPILCPFFFSHILPAQADVEKKLQTQLILAEDGDVIDLPAGKIDFSNTLSLDAKNNITLRGAGQDKTILSFLNQKQGAE